MKIGKAHCCMLLFSFFALTVNKTQQLLNTDQRTNQKKCFDHETHAWYMNAKQKEIVQGRGFPNMNLGLFVCFFDVRRAS